MTTQSLNQFLTDQGFASHRFRRSAVGHLLLTGELQGESIDLLIDTGASSTVVDLQWCRARKVPLHDTGRRGGGAGGGELAIYALPGASLTLRGMPLSSEGIFALDLSHVNRALETRNAPPVVGVIGGDVLLRHDAVLDYATDSLYLHACAE